MAAAVHPSPPRIEAPPASSRVPPPPLSLAAVDDEHTQLTVLPWADGAMPAEAKAMLASALPFVESAGKPPPPIESELTEYDENNPLNRTASITDSTALQDLPFRRSPAAGAAGDAPASQPHPPPGRPHPPASSEAFEGDDDALNRTASIMDSAALQELPFRERPPPSTPPQSRPGQPYGAPGQNLPDPQPANASPRSVSANEVALPPHLEALGVEHYAALCVAIRLHPEAAGEARSRYHIRDEREHVALDRRWSERMAADPRLHTMWRWYVQRYEQWMRSQGG